MRKCAASEEDQKNCNFRYALCDGCVECDYYVKEKIEIDKIKNALGLLNSMIHCGKKHTDDSIKCFSEAMTEIKKIKKHYE